MILPFSTHEVTDQMGAALLERFSAVFVPAISEERWSRYQQNRDDLEALVCYFWNAALAESLFCSLNIVEVFLRNTLHSALSEQFGTPTWYDRQGVLDQHQLRDVAKAKSRIIGYRRTMSPGRVVAELNFGFWVTTLSQPYGARLWTPNHPYALKAAFPGIPRRLRQVRTIQARCNEIRQLRNRVFHHEPIFDRPHLAQHHNDIIEAIAWISPEVSKAIQRFDRFPEVFGHGKARIDHEMRSMFAV